MSLLLKLNERREDITGNQGCDININANRSNPLESRSVLPSISTFLIDKNAKKQVFIKKEQNEGQWNILEQKRFLEGIAMYGLTRNTRSKIQELIKTRSNDQIFSFTQKFFIRMKNKVVERTAVKKPEDSIEMLELIFGVLVAEMNALSVSQPSIEAFLSKKEGFGIIFRKKYFDSLFSEKYINIGLDLKYKEKEKLKDEDGLTNNLSELTVTTAGNSYSETRTATQSVSSKALINFSQKSSSFLTQKLDLIESISLRSDNCTQLNFNIHDQSSQYGTVLNKEDFLNRSSIEQGQKNAFEDIMLHFKEHIKPNQIKTPKASKYKKYVSNNFRSVNMKNISFLNDMTSASADQTTKVPQECLNYESSITDARMIESINSADENISYFNQKESQDSLAFRSILNEGDNVFEIASYTEEREQYRGNLFNHMSFVEDYNGSLLPSDNDFWK